MATNGKRKPIKKRKKPVKTAASKKPAKSSDTRQFIWVRTDGAAGGDVRPLFEAAAKEAGLPVSTWLRTVGIVAAKKALET